MAAAALAPGQEVSERYLPCVSQQMQALAASVARVAATDAPVLICGETGSGKSTLARQIYEDRPQRSGPLIVLLSATTPADAVDGLAQLSGRTVLFEEVGELAPGAQDSLVRLMAQQASRLGLRFISTSSCDLGELAQRHGMRADLRYRLDVVRLDIPPLRQRPDDIIFLAEHFLAMAARQHHLDARTLSSEARARLLEHRWDGNVRELQSCIVEAVLQCPQARLRAADLRLRATPSTVDPEAELSAALVRLHAAHPTDLYTLTQRLLLQWALHTCGGNRVRTATLLGIGRGSLRAKLRRHGLARSAEE